MRLTIDLPDELEAALKAQAQARGVSEEKYLVLTLSTWLQAPRPGSDPEQPDRPLETGRGMLAKYGGAPSAEEIDANRAAMFGGFAQDS